MLQVLILDIIAHLFYMTPESESFDFPKIFLAANFYFVSKKQVVYYCSSAPLMSLNVDFCDLPDRGRHL